MKCKHLYYHSKQAEQFALGRNDPLVIAGGFCKKFFPVGMWCYNKDYHHLCPGKGHQPIEVETPPVEIPPPVEIAPPIEIPVEPETPPIEHRHKGRGRPRK